MADGAVGAHALHPVGVALRLGSATIPRPRMEVPIALAPAALYVTRRTAWKLSMVDGAVGEHALHLAVEALRLAPAQTHRLKMVVPIALARPLRHVMFRSVP